MPRMALLERQPLLASLAAQLADATHGRGSMVLVMGEAGAGKTSLARAFCAEQAAATTVLWGSCDALRTPRPLGPLRDIARTAGGALADLVAADAPRHQVFTAFLDLLAAQPATVVVVEDVHWADEATLDLLLFVGRRVTDTRAVVIATLRDDEVGRDHRLRVVLGDLATARSVRRLAVPPLSRAAVRSLALSHSHDPDAVYEVTNGNPFFVTEVLGQPDRGVPATVRDAVLARAARLSPAARTVLDLAAVVPDQVELDLLDAAVEECVRAGLLTVDGRYARFRHELARIAVDRAVPVLQRAGVHARVLAYLAAQPDVDLARLAYHAEEAGDREAVLTYAPAAAARAAGLGAHREATAHYARALRFVEDGPSARAAELWERLADEYGAVGQTGEAVDASGHALALWRQLGDREREGGQLARRAVHLWNAGHAAEAHLTVREAIGLLSGSPPGTALAAAMSTWAVLRMLARDFTGAIETGHEAIALVERYGDATMLARALQAVGCAQWFVEPDEASSTMARSLAAARESGDDYSTAMAMTNFGSGPGEIRRYDLADHWLRETIAYSAERDLDSARLYSVAWLARIRFEQGRWAEATDLATEAIGGPVGHSRRRTDVPNADRVALTVLGRLRVRRGDPDAATPLDLAWELAVQTGDLQRLWPVAAGRAEAAYLAGRPEVVQPLVRDSLQLAERLGHPWAVGELAYWLWRVGAIASAPPGAARPYALQIGRQPRLARAAWQGLGCPYEAAVALSETDDPADMLTALGELNALGAWPAAEQLSRRLRELGMRRLPRRPRRSTMDHPARLTAREVEILALLPDGLRNVDIAARLHISPKTVDHHVSAILAKLGVGSRREAADWARRGKDGEHRELADPT
jgi:DNA-binding CsgD family transcriptional regulator/tetratricopeptide (TPR) repeat protein